MADEHTEDKQVETQTVDTNNAEAGRDEAEAIMDKLLDEHEAGKDTQSESSTDEATTETETEGVEKTDVDPDNNKKEVEATEETEVTEGEIPVKYSDNPAWQRILKERNEAREAKAELESKLSTKQEVDIQEITSSPEYIRAKMEREGYKEEVIESALEKAGHVEPQKQQDIVDTVIEKLGYKKENLTQEQSDYIHDIVKVSNIVAQTGRDPELTGRLEAVEQAISGNSQKNGADAIMDNISKTIETEGILDMKIDIEPKLHKYLDDNPEANQEDVLDFFKDLNHKLILDRGSLAKKKSVRDGKKAIMNQNRHSVGKGGIAVPAKTGDGDKDCDAFLDSVGMYE